MCVNNVNILFPENTVLSSASSAPKSLVKDFSDFMLVTERGSEFKNEALLKHTGFVED